MYPNSETTAPYPPPFDLPADIDYICYSLPCGLQFIFTQLPSDPILPARHLRCHCCYFLFQITTFHLRNLLILTDLRALVCYLTFSLGGMATCLALFYLHHLAACHFPPPVPSRVPLQFAVATLPLHCRCSAVATCSHFLYLLQGLLISSPSLDVYGSGWWDGTGLRRAITLPCRVSGVLRCVLTLTAILPVPVLFEFI